MGKDSVKGVYNNIMTDEQKIRDLTEKMSIMVENVNTLVLMITELVTKLSVEGFDNKKIYPNSAQLNRL